MGPKPFGLWRRASGIYYYRLPGGTYRSTGESDERRALARVAAIAVQGGADVCNAVRTGAEISAPAVHILTPRAAAAGLTIREYSSTFFVWGECDWIRRQLAKHRPIGSPTAAMRRGHLVNHIYPRWGDVPMEELNPVDVETWLADLPLADGTKNHILYSLVIVVREAHREKRIRFNPLADVEPMGRTYRHRDALTNDELAQLFPEDLGDLVQIWGEARWAVGYLLMASTGIRVGEACAGQWRHVRWEIPAFLVLQAVKADHTVGAPKSGRPRGTLLPRRTVEVLTWWRGKTTAPREDDYLLPFVRKRQLGPVDPKALERAWAPAAARAGIPVAGRFLGAHALRHTYQTRLRGQVDDAALQYMLGHRGVAMSDRYDQGSPEERILRIAGAQSVLDGAWSAPPGLTG